MKLESARTLAALVSGLAIVSVKSTRSRDVRTCNELLKAVSVLHDSPAQPLVVYLQSEEFECQRGFEIAEEHDLTIVGSRDGTSMHVLPEVGGPSFIVNRGRLRITRIHFKGPGTGYSGEGVPGVAWDEREMRALENHEDLVVSLSSFSGFVAGDGGAISSSGPALVISDSSFYGNKASKELGVGAGGAVFASSDAPGRVDVFNSIFVDNIADGSWWDPYGEDRQAPYYSSDDFVSSSSGMELGGTISLGVTMVEESPVPEVGHVDFPSQDSGPAASALLEVTRSTFTGNRGGAVHFDRPGAVFRKCDFLESGSYPLLAAPLDHVDHLVVDNCRFWEGSLPVTASSTEEAMRAGAPGEKIAGRSVSDQSLSQSPDFASGAEPVTAEVRRILSTIEGGVDDVGFDPSPSVTEVESRLLGASSFADTSEHDPTTEPPYRSDSPTQAPSGYDNSRTPASAGEGNSTTPAPVYGDEGGHATPSPADGYGDGYNYTSPAPVYGSGDTWGDNSTSASSSSGFGSGGMNTTAANATDSPFFGTEAPTNSSSAEGADIISETGPPYYLSSSPAMAPSEAPAGSSSGGTGSTFPPQSDGSSGEDGQLVGEDESTGSSSGSSAGNEGEQDGQAAGFDEESSPEEAIERDPSVDDSSFVVKVMAGMFVAMCAIALGVYMLRRRRQSEVRGEFQSVPHRGLHEDDSL